MISVCVPYVRPDNISMLRKKIFKRSGFLEKDIQLLMEEDTERIGCPLMLKKLVNRSAGEYICFIGDDTNPQRNFLKIAYEELWRTFPNGIGVIGLNDRTGRIIPTHFFASKKILPLIGGEFFHTGYKHCYCDNELYDRVSKLNKYHYSKKSIVLHEHPLLNPSYPSDPDYDRVYSDEVKGADQKLYEERKKNQWR